MAVETNADFKLYSKLFSNNLTTIGILFPLLYPEKKKKKNKKEQKTILIETPLCTHFLLTHSILGCLIYFLFLTYI